MPPNRLKLLRVAVAVVVITGFIAVFADFRELLPAHWSHWLASTQLVPSLVALATGATFAIGVILVLVLTLAFGRVYCSALCPLGILQDIIARVAVLFRRKGHFLPHARPLTWLRHIFLWGTGAAVVAGWGGLALALLDPYSNFGRIASSIFRPLLVLANNAVVGTANAFGMHGVYRVDVPWAGAGVLVLVGGFFTAVAIMSALRGRLYCNTICPVGTLLGLIAARAAFRLRINGADCVKCGECVRHCKAQCIDLRNASIDASRCVACYDCVSSCDQHGIAHAYSWNTPVPWLRRHDTNRPTRGARASRPSRSETAGAPPAQPGFSKTSDIPSDDYDAHVPRNPGRRNFIVSVTTAVAGVVFAGHRTRAAGSDEIPTLAKTGKNSPAVSPPGSVGTAQFLSRCTACQLCVSACPTGVLQPGLLEYGVEGLLRPRLDFTTSFCNFDCTRCGEVCPTGAIGRLAAAEKQVTQIGIADFYPARCIVVTEGTDCAACSEHCPTKAVGTEPYGDNLRVPVMVQENCIGCGACEFACPAEPLKAIRVTGRRVHGRALKHVEKKAAAPATNGDFPF